MICDYCGKELGSGELHYSIDASGVKTACLECFDKADTWLYNMSFYSPNREECDLAYDVFTIGSRHLHLLKNVTYSFDEITKDIDEEWEEDWDK